jgi:hypothetical protein
MRPRRTLARRTQPTGENEPAPDQRLLPGETRPGLRRTTVRTPELHRQSNALEVERSNPTLKTLPIPPRAAGPTRRCQRLAAQPLCRCSLTLFSLRAPTGAEKCPAGLPADWNTSSRVCRYPSAKAVQMNTATDPGNDAVLKQVELRRGTGTQAGGLPHGRRFGLEFLNRGRVLKPSVSMPIQ